jgi:hypothetical protein
MDDTTTVDSASRARAFSVEVGRTDWFLVILALEKQGYTHRALAGVTMSSRSAIGHWRCGDHEPSHPSGEALIYLWMLVTEQPREMLPRRKVDQLSAARVK